MNPKNAGFFQKNIEKLILAVAVMFMLVFGWWFLMGEPFTVELGGQTVAPDQIEPRVTRRVKTLEKNLSETQSKLPDRPIPAYTQAFQEKLVRKSTTLAQLAPLAQPGLDKRWVDDIGDPTTYNLPRPPIAQGVITRKGHAVLSDDIRTRELEGLVKLIGDHQPRDFRYVSVAATFDMDEWVRRLQSGDKETRVPQRWWNGMLGIAGVMLQRQELDEATGQWGPAVLIDPLPTQLAFKPGERFPATSKQSKETILVIRANQEPMARSQFPKTLGNILWSPPNKDASELDADGQRKLARLNTRINKLNEQIRKLQEQIIQSRETQGRADRQRDNVRRPTRDSTRGGARGGATRGGADTGRSSRPTRTTGRRETTAQTPQTRLRQLEDQLIEAKLQRNELQGIESDVLSTERGGYRGGAGGADSYGQDLYGGGGRSVDLYRQTPGGYPGGANTYAGGAGDLQPTEPQSRKIKVWAHDLSIEPGKTYRYRVVVAVLNPLYRQKRIDEAQRAENYDMIALGPDADELAGSPWSNPVRVDSQYYFFMVKGSSKAQTARVQVWRVDDGRWVNKDFQVRPGDPIGRVIQIQLPNGFEKSLDMNIGLVVVDLVATGGGGLGGAGVRMLYLDPQSNRITDRTVEGDRNDPDRVRLLNEQALEADLALSDPSDTLAPSSY